MRNASIAGILFKLFLVVLLNQFDIQIYGNGYMYIWIKGNEKLKCTEYRPLVYFWHFQICGKNSLKETKS